MSASRLSFCLLAVAAVSWGQEHSHPHDGAPTTQPAGPGSGTVQLTEVMVQNLGLQTAEVEFRPMEKTFAALGAVEPAPGRVIDIASRVAGRVTKLAVFEGQHVEAGELLVEVESRVVADPPPTLAFNAPFAGVVLQTQIVPGAPVAPDEPMLRLADLSTVDVVARVLEARINRVRPDQSVRVEALAYPEAVYTGTVRTTAARVDRESGTVRVFVRVDNADGRLLPGMRAQLAFVVEQTEDAVVVPRAAVLGEAGDLFVFRELPGESHTYERTPVVTGLRDDRFVEIVEGVLPGDRVVTRGNYELQYVSGVAAATLEDDHGHSHGPGGHQH